MGGVETGDRGLGQGMKVNKLCQVVGRCPALPVSTHICGHQLMGMLASGEQAPDSAFTECSYESWSENQLLFLRSLKQIGLTVAQIMNFFLPKSDLN